MAAGTHGATQETAVRTNIFVRALIYAVLIVFAVYYLMPLYVAATSHHLSSWTCLANVMRTL